MAAARNKLNQLYATGSLILAAYIGLVFNSWLAFGAASASLLVLNVFGGNIRLVGSRR
jgi:acyl dehydratase